MREKLVKYEIDLETANKKLEAAERMKLQATASRTTYKPGIGSAERQEGSGVRSPKGSRAQGYERGYMSPGESSR